MKTLKILPTFLVVSPLIAFLGLAWRAAAQDQPIPRSFVSAHSVAVVAHVIHGGRTPAASDVKAETQLKEKACLLLQTNRFLTIEDDPRQADLVLLLLGGKWIESDGGVIGMVFPGGPTSQQVPPLWVVQSARGRRHRDELDEVITSFENVIEEGRLSSKQPSTLSRPTPLTEPDSKLSDTQIPGPLPSQALTGGTRSAFPSALLTGKTFAVLDYFDQYPFGYTTKEKKPNKGSLDYALKKSGLYTVVDDPSKADLIFVIYKDFSSYWSTRKDRTVSEAREALIVLDGREPTNWEATPLWMEQVGESDWALQNLDIKRDLVGILRKDLERQE